MSAALRLAVSPDCSQNPTSLLEFPLLLSKAYVKPGPIPVSLGHQIPFGGVGSGALAPGPGGHVSGGGAGICSGAF